MNKKMKIIVAALALLGLPSSAAFAQGKGEQVKIQDYPGIGNMLFRVAIAKGYCEKHGIKCQLQIIPTGPLGAQALLAKSIDVAVVGPETQIMAMLKGAKLVAPFSVAILNPFQLLVRNEPGTPNAADGYKAIMMALKGKKIGVPARGSVAELQFGQLALRAGLKPEDYTFVAVGGPQTAYGALTSKQVDASMNFEPSGSMCEVLKTCKIVFRASEAKEPIEVAGTNGASVIAVVTRDMAEKSPHVVAALTAAAKDAEAFIQDPKNFDELLAIAQSYFKFDMPRGDEVMAVSLKNGIPGYRTAIDASALKQIADNMVATKQIDAPFDTTKLIRDKAP